MAAATREQNDESQAMPVLGSHCTLSVTKPTLTEKNSPRRRPVFTKVVAVFLFPLTNESLLPPPCLASTPGYVGVGRVDPPGKVFRVSW